MSQYNGALTREQFMFREMRITARLYSEGSSEKEIAAKIVQENLFQYPTERETRGKCRVALRRLGHISGSAFLLDALAQGTVADARKVALVAMMCDSRLTAEFMVDVVGGKLGSLDRSLTQKDVNLFFAQLAERDEKVAGWSDATVKRIKSVLMNVLRENGYLEGKGSETLQPVLVSDEFEAALKAMGLSSFLPAFQVLK